MVGWSQSWFITIKEYYKGWFGGTPLTWERPKWWYHMVHQKWSDTKQRLLGVHHGATLKFIILSGALIIELVITTVSSLGDITWRPMTDSAMRGGAVSSCQTSGWSCDDLCKSQRCPRWMGVESRQLIVGRSCRVSNQEGISVVSMMEEPETVILIHHHSKLGWNFYSFLKLYWCYAVCISVKL